MNNKIISNNKGLTLIEVLAITILTALIFALVTPILVKGMDQFNKIKSETILRDEADIITAQLIKEIYTLQETKIISFVKKKETSDPDNYYITYTKNNKNDSNDHPIEFLTGFKDGKLIIANNEYTFSQSDIELNSINKSTIEKVEDNNYLINLQIVNTTKNYPMLFKNEIRSINDIKIQEGD